jgi:prophage tail gpP-like protein
MPAGQLLVPEVTVTGGYTLDNDRPELGSIKLHIYPPAGQVSPGNLPPTTIYNTRLVAERPYTPLVDNYVEIVTNQADYQNNPQLAGPAAVFYQQRTGAVTTLPGKPLPVAPSWGTAQDFPHFLSYSYTESYLVPTDVSSFTLSEDELSDDQRRVLTPGAKVEITVDDCQQSTGYIDKVRTHASHGEGTVITIEVGNWLQPAVDSQVDPQVRFLPSMSLLDVLNAIYTPFGMDVLDPDGQATVNAVTGRIYGTPTSKKGKPLKSYIVHQLKPYPNEGAHAFASRVSQRFGLWLRPSCLYGTLIVSKPDFGEPFTPGSVSVPRYTLHHKRDPTNAPYNNVLESDTDASREEQFSVAFCSGFGGGGDVAKSTLRTAIFNPLINIPPVQKTQLLASYPGIAIYTDPQLAALAQTDLYGQTLFPLADPNARPIYLYDPESHDMAQLQAFARKELSLRMRKGYTATYTIEGHKLNGQPVAVDSLIDVDDDRSNLHRTMWVLARHFKKAAGSRGTTTTLELIRPGSLQF